MKKKTYLGDILVVDDTVANLRLLVNLLNEQQYKVRAVPNGKLALQVAKSEIPDLILLDINMPEMSGYEVCEKLKEDEATRDVPIIFISALDEVTDKIKAFTTGGVDYITKPIQFEEVMARVENHLSIQRLQKELQRSNQKLEEANEVLEQRVEERTVALRTQMELFQKFVPEIFTEHLDDKNVYEGFAREETFTVFSCDIRDFISLSESAGSVDCYRFLNSFFGVMEPGIRDSGGFVYQYVGDEIMALFKLEEGEYADNAVQAAVNIQNKVLVEFNEGRNRTGYVPVRIGIGINTGPVAIGIAGTPNRMDACAFGSTVNLAARCEGLTKDLERKVIITEHTYSRLRNPGDFNVQSLGVKDIRGMDEQVHLYDVVVDGGD